jgi:hypothetical protein
MLDELLVEHGWIFRIATKHIPVNDAFSSLIED